MAAIMLTKAQRDAYLELATMWRKLADETGKHRRRVEAWAQRTTPSPSVLNSGANGADHAPVMDAD
jgi:hypothetical protein